MSYGAVPPVIVNSADPESPLHKASVNVAVATNASGSDIVNSSDVSHPLASITVVV